MLPRIQEHTININRRSGVDSFANIYGVFEIIPVLQHIGIRRFNEA